MIRAIVYRERYFGICAVHRTRRGEYQVLYAPAMATFENICEAHQIALGVSIRVLERIAHAYLCGQIHYYFRTLVGKNLVHALTIGQI